jgi:hypothetical protein
MKKKTLKRVLAAMLALMLCFTLLPSGSSYAEDVENQQMESSSASEDETLEEEAATEEAVEVDLQAATEEITEDNMTAPVSDIEIQEEEAVTEPEVTDEEAAATEDVTEAVIEEEWLSDLTTYDRKASSISGLGSKVGTTTVYINSSTKYYYGAGNDAFTTPMSTYSNFSINNVFCIDPRYTAPANGASCGMYEVDDDIIRAMLYYSVGAPGYNAQKEYINTVMTQVIGAASQKNLVIMSHLALAKRASEKGWVQSTGGWTAGLDSTWVTGATNYYALFVNNGPLSSVPEGFHAYFLADGNSTTQGLLTWTYSPIARARVCKSSDNPDLTNGYTGYGQQYSFDGAVYVISSDYSVMENVNKSNYTEYWKNNKIAVMKITQSETDKMAGCG